MVDIHTTTGELKARIDIEKNIDDFDYSLKILFVRENQYAYIKLNKKELRELRRDISYLLEER